MNFVRTLVVLGGTLVAVCCAATVTSQVVGVAVLASQGALDEPRRIRYAGILYGLDPLDMAPQRGSSASKDPAHAGPEERSRDEILSERAQTTPSIADRLLAIRKGTDDIRSVVLALKTKRERQELSRKVFESYLQQLETENTVSALREVQVTLESLPPKQAKAILFAMLTDPQDQGNVLPDVVAVVKAMPADKIRKIVGEFKTEEEREMLHDILVELGQLDSRQAKWTGAPP